MAGLSSTSCCSSSSFTLTPISSKPFLTKPLFFPSFNSLRFHFPQLRKTFYYSTAVSARYYGDGDGDFQTKSNSDYDAALDIDSISSPNVRLIDDDQNMLGIVSKNEALQRAEDEELDLVIISPEAEPPVVKIMDYNKYKYEMQKKKKVQQKKSAAGRVDLKELKMGYRIDSHDYSVRLRAALKFLKDGDKVKVIVNLKGRENEFRNIAIELIRRFQNDIGELAIEESKNFRERNIYIVLVPNKAFVLKGQEQPKKKEDLAAEVSASENSSTEVSASENSSTEVSASENPSTEVSTNETPATEVPASV